MADINLRKSKPSPPGLNWCIKHEDFLPVKMFYKSKSHQSGLSTYCKEHQKEISLNYRKRDEEKYLKMMAGYRTEQYKRDRGGLGFELKRRLSNTKILAKKHHLEHNLDLEYLLNLYKEQGERCPISGRVLEFSQYVKGAVGPNRKSPGSENNLSVDRIDSTKGYIKGNVRLVIWAVNRALSNRGLNKLIALCEDTLRTQGIYLEEAVKEAIKIS